MLVGTALIRKVNFRPAEVALQRWGRGGQQYSLLGKPDHLPLPSEAATLPKAKPICMELVRLSQSHTIQAAPKFPGAMLKPGGSAPAHQPLHLLLPETLLALPLVVLQQIALLAAQL